ncbi:MULTISPECIES: NAD(P)-dependent oxidoreductase [unclassified Thioalkalivibrio]|uniref:NAD(P)-dependent oxidoreductase n=1 Tax=unclassified Thioalkalivibrio TaxID=2621013 RepID=UPI00037A3DB6|nr:MULTISPECIES: NAD(P)-dependent oxidoreductase [unclassified Thioalkalivibrio]
MSASQIPPELQPIGAIGIGIMGAPMNRNLLAAGADVQVWARRPETAEALAQDGAQPCASLPELVRGVRVLVLNVSDTPDVEALMLGPDGILEHARPGLIVIDHSTIDPMRTRAIARAAAEREVTFVDAPVSGGEPGARTGTLSLMVGGPAAVVESLRPIFDVVGSTLTHVGESGAGQIAKACNQLVVGETLVAVGEAFALAEQSGVDPARVREALMGGFASSRILEVHGQRLLDGDFEPGFQIGLYHKDLGIIADLSRDLGLATEGLKPVRQAVDAALEAGQARHDVSILARFCVRAGESSS